MDFKLQSFRILGGGGGIRNDYRSFSSPVRKLLMSSKAASFPVGPLEACRSFVLVA